MAAPDEAFWYPTLEDVLAIHDDIVSEDADSEPGVENRERVQYALDSVEHGHFGEGPETVHEKAFHLMRLLASNHWFVDGNKRTALNTTEVFYLFNGYKFHYGEDVRSILKLLAVRENLINPDVAVKFFAEKTTRNPDFLGAESGLDLLGQLLGARRLPNALETMLKFVADDHND